MVNNPFPKNSDRAEIWTMLVARDIQAFVNADWGMVDKDFIPEGFIGIDGKKINDPDQWTITFPNLELYKEEWLRQAEIFKNTDWSGNCIEDLHSLTDLTQIDVTGDVALAHKKFDGYLTKSDGQKDYLKWQTLYQCRKHRGRWKISGFVGYLPYPLGEQGTKGGVIQIPHEATQHSTAGPYSPVLEISSDKLVVISGQAAIDRDGNVVGDDIESQTRYTLENCQMQLAAAGCTLDDVFKVNVYLRDLADWPKFDEIYSTYFSNPLPVRTAVQTPLLMTLLVEIECWAAL